MAPFLILIAASVYGCVRVIVIADMNNFFGMLIIVFWMIRNMYFMIMSIFLINGRDSDEDTAEVKVKTGEMIQISKDGEELTSDGISTLLTEHSMQVFLDEDSIFRTGDIISIQVDTIDYSAKLKGIITGIRFLRFSGQCLARIEILDYNQQHDAYLQILYDRVPTLPQSLNRDFRTMSLLWRNIVYRLMRTL